MNGTITFHRDRIGLRRAAWVCVAAIAVYAATIAAVTGQDLVPWIIVLIDAVMLAGIACFGILLVVTLGPAARVSECLVVDSDRIRCSLPSSVVRMQRRDVAAIRVRNRFGTRWIELDSVGKLDGALSGASPLKRWAVQYSVWAGHGAINVGDVQINESIDEVEAAFAALWPEVPMLRRSPRERGHEPGKGALGPAVLLFGAVALGALFTYALVRALTSAGSVPLASLIILGIGCAANIARYRERQRRARSSTDQHPV